MHGAALLAPTVRLAVPMAACAFVGSPTRVSPKRISPFANRLPAHARGPWTW